jgi:hypothetical protein
LFARDPLLQGSSTFQIVRATAKDSAGHALKTPALLDPESVSEVVVGLFNALTCVVKDMELNDWVSSCLLLSKDFSL